MEGFLLIALIGAGIFFFTWLAGVRRKAQLYEVNKPKIDKLEYERRAFERSKHEALAEIERSNQQIESARQAHSQEVERDKSALEKMAAEKSTGFPWLATAYADYFALLDQQRAQALRSKKHPARKAADEIREVKKEKREAEKKWRVLRYRLLYYETLFPWLVDFVGENVDDYIKIALEGSNELPADEEVDPARVYLSEGEYQSLTHAEKYQRALDRYRARKKSSWEIGRDFERFIGYRYETEGFEVEYFGIFQGLEDLGRDIVARKDATTKIVQCKYWSQSKLIHEKHLFQLFGTVIEYVMRKAQAGVREQGSFFDGLEGLGKIAPIFVTSTKLSDTARDVARLLRITTEENVRIPSYPIIKCNVARRDGERIYHLPFDQQYDRIKVEPHRGERYVQTVADAENLGFRRAWRWRPEKGD